MFRQIWITMIIVACGLTATAAFGQTRPQASESGPSAQRIRISFEVPATESGDDAARDLQSLVGNVRVAVSGRTLAVIGDSASPIPSDGNAHGDKYSIDIFKVLVTASGLRTNDTLMVYELPPKDLDDFCHAIEAQLKAIPKEDEGLTAEQRTARVLEISAQVADIDARIRILHAIIPASAGPAGGAARGGATNPFPERKAYLRQEIERLDSEGTALDAKQKALMGNIDMQREQAKAKIQDDPIAQELQKVVQMRQDMLDKTKAMADAGAMTPDQSGDAEMALADARIRLAERQDSLGKGGKGELLDRLSDELAMLSVDVEVNHIQLQKDHQELDLYQRATVDPQALQELMDAHPELAPRQPQTRPSLLSQLQADVDKLRQERLALTLTDLSVTPIAAQ